MMNDQLSPIHPGEVLLEEFPKPMGISQNQLALSINEPARRINEIVLGKRRITAIPRFAWRAFSALHLGSGWGCKPITTWT
jgi:addiction module HigA family antidote